MDDNNYIPTAQYNYVIGKHYLSTDDPNLATVFYEIKHQKIYQAIHSPCGTSSQKILIGHVNVRRKSENAAKV